MNELTYILGAGASYQSIPIVKTFGKRFERFLYYLNEVVINTDFEEVKRNKFKRAYNISKDLCNAFESHQSFDTYFKKLFHTGQTKKINEAKKILNLYFTWEHLIDSTDRPENYNDLVFWKQTNIDKRYDALIAGLLKPISDTSEPYCKINFITWNYDLNLLCSLKNYYLPTGTFKEFFTSIIKQDDEWIIGGNFSIFNMNGYFYSSQFDDMRNLENASIHNIIFNEMQDDYFDDFYIDKDASLIKFAWEENNKSCKKLKEIIRDSNNIVTIGYTFPLYNRLIDLEYLEQSTIVRKKFYIQDPNAEALRQNVLDYYQLNSYTEFKSNLTALTNCDSFYIPSDIFGISEFQPEGFYTLG